MTDGQRKYFAELCECSMSRENVWLKLQLPPLGGSLFISWEPQVQKKSNPFLHSMTPTKLDDSQISYLFLQIYIGPHIFLSTFYLFHLRPLNFKPRFKFIQHNQLNSRVQFAAGSRVPNRSNKALISSDVCPLSYQIGTGYSQSLIT